MTIDNRTLSMTVPYSLDDNEEENFFFKIITHNRSEKVLIRLNLNIIQCFNEKFFNWSSVESTSTLRGEFVRTTFLDTNLMYLSTGITYLRNLTTIDCLTKTIYRTDNRELFQINLKIESTLNDYCSNKNLCYPLDIYQCDYERQRCICRSSLQSYLTHDHYSICIHPVENIDQCKIKNIRCVEWCHQDNTTTMCICPKDLSTKKYLDDNRAYCESRTNGICNSFIQCPLGNICVHGTCHNTDYKLQQFMSLDVVTISIVVSSLVLVAIIIVLATSICILRRQRWKKRYHPSSIDRVYKKKQQMNLPTTSDYDNIIYGGFRNNVQISSTKLPSIDDNINDTLPFTASDSSTYHPKIVFLGGEQQLTAIYA